MFCQNCGVQIPGDANVCPNCGNQVASQPVLYQTVVSKPTVEEKIKNFTVWKTVSGILSILIFAFMTLQSCAVNLSASLSNSDDTSGVGGMVVAVFILAAGITSLAGRKSRGANIAILVMSFLGSVAGFATKGMYSDLKFWSIWLAILGVFALLAFIFYKPKKNR